MKKSGGFKDLILISYLALVALFFTFDSQQTLFYFPFTSKLLVNHQMVGSFFKGSYFGLQLLLLVSFLLLINFSNSRFKFNKLNLPIIYSIFAGILFNVILYLYFVLTITIFYILLTQANSLKKKQQKSRYVFIHVLLFILLPWSLVFIDKSFDKGRIIFMQLLGIKSILYLYDLFKEKIELNYKKMFLYFLFPLHFFIFPSWIVFPFPSDFIETNVPHGLNFKSSYRILNRGFIYLAMIFWFNFIMTTLLNRQLNSFTYLLLPSLKTPDLLATIAQFSRGILTILYFYFIAETLKNLYPILGFSYNRPAFNSPLKATNIFDFWNRFLIHIKDFIVKLYFFPAFTFFFSRTRNTNLSIFITMFIGFAFVNMGCHIVYVYNFDFLKYSLLGNPSNLLRWYALLLTIFSLFYYIPKIFSKKILSLYHHQVTRYLKIVFIYLFICFCY